MKSVCDTMNFDTYFEHTNVALILKHLYRKGFIQKDFCQQQIDRWLEEQERYHQFYTEGQNLDSNEAVLQTEMRMSAFASTQLIDEKVDLICKRSYAVVVISPLNLSQNRKFLGLIGEKPI